MRRDYNRNISRKTPAPVVGGVTLYESVRRQSNIGVVDQNGMVFFRFGLCAECDPRLECGNGPALRTLLAGLIGIATSFGSEEDEFPPSAVDESEFRAQARPQPSAQPRLSDLAGRWPKRRFALSEGGRTSGHDFGRLRSSMCSKILSVCRLRRRLMFFRCRRMPRSPIGLAGCVRSAGRFSDSSQGSCSARRSKRSYSSASKNGKG
jgi:hypothetical protein